MGFYFIIIYFPADRCGERRVTVVCFQTIGVCEQRTVRS
mgnify:CR=1 FL=1